MTATFAWVREMHLQGVYVLDPDPERYIREMACHALGVDEVDLTFVTFVTDPEGFTVATGRVVVD